MKSFLRKAKYRLISRPIFPVLNAPFRAFNTWQTYIGPQVRRWLSWIVSSREDSNFTYDLTERCKFTLAASVASFLQREFSEVDGYFREIETDQEFIDHVRDLWREHPERGRTDRTPHVGRRMVWYAVARALKPKVVIETGVDQGMGAAVLCAALLRNTAEGYPGRYHGTDLNPNAGYFLRGRYAEMGSILYGDSITSLAKFDGEIELFINDSDHSADYEAAEYQTVKGKLSPNAVIVGDNAHVTSKLAEFSVQEGRPFMYFAEEPAQHWYGGGGIGISLARDHLMAVTAVPHPLAPEK